MRQLSTNVSEIFIRIFLRIVPALTKALTACGIKFGTVNFLTACAFECKMAVAEGSVSFDFLSCIIFLGNQLRRHAHH